MHEAPWAKGPLDDDLAAPSTQHALPMAATGDFLPADLAALFANVPAQLPQPNGHEMLPRSDWPPLHHPTPRVGTTRSDTAADVGRTQSPVLRRSAPQSTNP